MECYNVLGDGKLSGVSWSTGGLKGMEREDAKTWRGVGIWGTKQHSAREMELDSAGSENTVDG